MGKIRNIRKHSSRTIRYLFAIFAVLFIFPVLACTRSASTPAELTAIAQRVDVYRTPTVAPTEISPQQTDSPAVSISVVEDDALSPADTPQTVPVRATLAVDMAAPTPTVDLAPTAAALKKTHAVSPRIAPDMPELKSSDEGVFYTVCRGETLDGLALRHGVSPDEVLFLNADVKTDGFLKPGTAAFLPSVPRQYSKSADILPDEYVTMGWPAIGYDLISEVNRAGGHLADYTEYVNQDGWLSGTELILKVARDYSISPIVLLELLEYKSHWLYGEPSTIAEEMYPMGWLSEASQGLYKQLVWAAQQLSFGYYGWRYGTLSEIPFYKVPYPDEPIYFNPKLNAGSVAIQYLFAQICSYEEYEEAIYGENGFLQQFYLDFGNVWDEYEEDPDSFTDTMVQPTLTLPYYKWDSWNLTGGPHEAWTTGSPLGAIDFAPQMSESGCAQSNSWVTACAPGLVIRTGPGLVVVDMDMDGNEETGWVMIYLHVATRDRVQVGKTLALHSRIGHPSCEGGAATGTHVHVARKYNGEWVRAYGPVPFVMSDWLPFGGDSYKGGLERDGRTVYAVDHASVDSLIGY